MCVIMGFASPSEKSQGHAHSILVFSVILTRVQESIVWFRFATFSAPTRHSQKNRQALKNFCHYLLKTNEAKFEGSGGQVLRRLQTE